MENGNKPLEPLVADVDRRLVREKGRDTVIVVKTDEGLSEVGSPEGCGLNM